MNLELRNSGIGIGNKDLSDRIIAAAIAVHRELGPGFLESIYETALAAEFEFAGILFERQKTLPLFYRGKAIGEHRLDFFVENSFVVELKAIAELERIHFTIVRSYMKAAGASDALLLNFATMPLTIKRVGREAAHRELSEDINLHS